VLLALIVGLPPALRAMRLNIVDALGKREARLRPCSSS
jgi:ABC-type antimicrobial peptide transport system permease subunit